MFCWLIFVPVLPKLLIIFPSQPEAALDILWPSWVITFHMVVYIHMVIRSNHFERTWFKSIKYKKPFHRGIFSTLSLLASAQSPPSHLECLLITSAHISEFYPSLKAHLKYQPFAETIPITSTQCDCPPLCIAKVACFLLMPFKTAYGLGHIFNLSLGRFYISRGHKLYLLNLHTLCLTYIMND